MNDTIIPTLDRKTRARNAQKNTFGLMPLTTCPGKTMGKGGCAYTKPGNKTAICYADQLSRMPSVKKVLQRNTDLLTGATREEMVALLVKEFTRFRDLELKNGNKDTLVYRFHWSGDIFSEDYAYAIGEATAQFADVFFWIYTRSINLVEGNHEASATTLAAIVKNKNVVMLLSVDVCNFYESIRTFMLMDPKRFNGRLRLAMMLDNNDIEARIDALPDYPRRQLYAWLGKGIPITQCPTNDDPGAFDGACLKCQRCMKPGKEVVWFKTAGPPNNRQGKRRKNDKGAHGHPAKETLSVQLEEQEADKHNTRKGATVDDNYGKTLYIRRDGHGSNLCGNDEGCDNKDGASVKIHVRTWAGQTPYDACTVTGTRAAGIPIYDNRSRKGVVQRSKIKATRLEEVAVTRGCNVRA